MLGVGGRWLGRHTMGSWGLDSWGRECLVPLGNPGAATWLEPLHFPPWTRPRRVEVGSRPPPLPVLTSAEPGLPPARLPTASCARRSSSNSGSSSGRGAGARRRPRPRMAGLMCPMSGLSRPHVPSTPAQPRPAPAVTGAAGATATSSRRPSAAPAPPAPPHAAPPSCQDNSMPARRWREQLPNATWEPASIPHSLKIPDVPPHARIQPEVWSWTLGLWI